MEDKTELSTDERTRMIAEAREKVRRDEASRINSAEKRGREEGREEGKREKAIAVARKLLGLNMPIDEIVEATDLSCEEIKALG